MSRKKIDWAAEAKLAVSKLAVEYTADQMFPSDRGAMTWLKGITVVYGNDGLADNQRAIDRLADVRTYRPATRPSPTRAGRAIDRLADVRTYLAEHGIEELGFATALEGNRWAMLVRSPDHQALDDVIWASETFNRRLNRLRVIRLKVIQVRNLRSAHYTSN